MDKFLDKNWRAAYNTRHIFTDSSGRIDIWADVNEMFGLICKMHHQYKDKDAEDFLYKLSQQVDTT